MHNSSIELMKKFVAKYLLPQKTKILDVGSYNVNGCYKPLFNNPLWEYQGLDIVAGPNVDLVETEVPWSLQNETYDIVISGQTLEHVKAPWIWIKELERVCKPGGIIIVIAPSRFYIHRHPVDCWRILPDGMTYLLSEWCNCDMLEVGISPINNTSDDCFGVAKKRQTPSHTP